MTSTPIMTLRVPPDAEMRKALREAAKGLREGWILAPALLDWLEQSKTVTTRIQERISALERRVSLIEDAIDASTNAHQRHPVKP